MATVCPSVLPLSRELAPVCDGNISRAIGKTASCDRELHRATLSKTRYVCKESMMLLVESTSETARGGFRRAFASAILCVAVVVTGSSPSHGSQADIGQAVVDGVAEIFGSTCPFGDWLPEVPTECEDWLVFLYKESRPKQHNQTPWGVFLVRALSVVHPGGNVEALDETWGITYDVDSSFDERHLEWARARASVPMSDGSTSEVDLVWDGTGVPLKVAGNSGPYHTNSGIDRHVVDRCITFNQNYQQAYRANVSVAGTIDATDVEDIPYFIPTDPFIGRGRFINIEVIHGNCD